MWKEFLFEGGAVLAGVDREAVAALPLQVSKAR